MKQLTMKDVAFLLDAMDDLHHAEPWVTSMGVRLPNGGSVTLTATEREKRVGDVMVKSREVALKEVTSPGMGIQITYDANVGKLLV